MERLSGNLTARIAEAVHNRAAINLQLAELSSLVDLLAGHPEFKRLDYIASTPKGVQE